MSRQELPSIAPDMILPDLKTLSRKQALKSVARVVARTTPFSVEMLTDMLLQQERDGSSGIGDGVAIPHLRISGVPSPLTVFAKLRNRVDFDAVDGQPVDMIYLLISPEDEQTGHLRRLAKISRTLKNRYLCKKLRGAENEDAIRAILADFECPVGSVRQLSPEFPPEQDNVRQ